MRSLNLVHNALGKICSKCLGFKPYENFKKKSHSKDGFYSQCKPCVSAIRSSPENRKKSNEYQREKAKLPHVKKYHAEYRRKYRNTEKGQERMQDYFLKTLYGISVERYNEMFAEQNGCCAICEKHQSGFKRRLAVDHNHSTGAIRALLCHHCNTALGAFDDDVELLKKASQYLKTFTKE